MDDDIPQDQRQAASDLNDIAALERSLPFVRYFMQEPAREVARLEKDLTDPADMEQRDRSRKLGELAVWRRMVRKLAEDRSANRRILGLPEKDIDTGADAAT